MSGAVITATCGQNLNWSLMLALPAASLSTSKARALLPPTYSRTDAVANVHNTALLVSAFAQDRPELLQAAMSDRLHQPYREVACTLLPLLLPLAGNGGIYGVALSGAGPSVLLIVDPAMPFEPVLDAIRQAAGLQDLEILRTTIASGAYDR